MAACKRVIQSGLGANLTRWRGFDASKVSSAAAASYSAESFRFDGSSMCLSSYLSSNWYDSRYDHRNISQLVKQTGKLLFPVDTLALVRSLEAQGIPSKHAEAITTAITEVLNDSLENVAESFVTKTDMQKSEMLQDANLAKFKSEVQNSQEREAEKLKSDIDKIRSELRYEIDKVTTGQRLDLTLERGRIRDELANQNAETTNITNKLDREIHGSKAQLEATKYEVIKYCIGTLVSMSVLGLAVLRISF